jgi:predicted ATPase with chaperone activity
MVSRYQKRISGPLLDRIDIHIDVPRVEYEKLSDERLGEPSATIQARVLLGFEPRVTLEDGLPDVLAWVRQQRVEDHVAQAEEILAAKDLMN